MSISDLGTWLTRERMRLYAGAFFLATLTLYTAKVVRSSHLVEPDGQIVGRDYLAFHMAGDMVRQGRTDRLYDHLAQQAYQQQFMRDINPHWSGTCLYLNPPHFAWMMSWLAPLEYGRSLAAWTLASLACFAATVLIWRRWLQPEQFALAVILAVCMPAWFHALAGGQNSFLTLLILTSFCALLIGGRPLAAGLVLSLLGYKFQFLLVPAAWLACTRRWRAVGGLCIGGTLTLSATAIVMGPTVIMDYFAFGSRLGELMQCDGFDVHKQCSWYGLFQLAGMGLMPALSVRILAVTASIVTLALLLPMHKNRPQDEAADLPIQLSAMLVAMLATSPHLFHYDMLLAVLPAVLWLRARREPDIAGATATVKPILALGFAALAAAGILNELLRIQVLPLLMVWWLAVYVRWAQHRRESTDPRNAAIVCETG